MGMKEQVARPGVKNAHHADLGAEAVGVLRQGLSSLSRGLEQSVVDDILVLAGDGA